PIISSATISIAAHAMLIGAWVVSTMPSAEMAPDSIANRVYYIPPPDRVPSQGGSRETVHYITLAKEGPGTGEGPRMMGEARPPITADTVVGDQARDTVTAPQVEPTPGNDSVYSVLEVDSAVVRSASSAAPAYPIKLLESHTMGYVQAQYVVDTTGFADTTSFRVIKATHPDFITAVKEALPY